jgi:hypothetical protein
MSFGTLFLSPVLARFALAHPGMELWTDYDDRALDLIREGFDLALRICEARDSALIGRTLCNDQMIACASLACLTRHGHPATPADLAGHQVLSYSRLPDARLWQVEMDARLAPAPVRSRLTLNNGDAIRDNPVPETDTKAQDGQKGGFVAADPQVRRKRPKRAGTLRVPAQPCRLRPAGREVADRR